MKVLLKKRMCRYLTVIATITFITACSTTETLPEDIPPALFSELDADSNFYLRKDDQLGSDENLTWQFLAIQALIKEKKFIMADAVIASLQENDLNSAQATTLQLLIADKYYAQGNLTEAQSMLNAIDENSLATAEKIHFLKFQATLYLDNALALEASDTLLKLLPLLTLDTEKKDYYQLLFSQLLLLPNEQLTQYNAQINNQQQDNLDNQQQVTDIAEVVEITEVTDVTDVATLPAEMTTELSQASEALTDTAQINKQGWYALAALYQNNKLRPNRLKRALTIWETQYSDHPARSFMPQELTDIPEFSPYQPDDIAVLLPLSGRFEKQGKAIQLGLLNAYYHQQKIDDNGANIKQPKLHFFDTQVTNAEQLASQLKKAKVDFVVGPLMKSEIASLLPLIEDMPVLALNQFAEKIKPLEQATAKEKPETVTGLEGDAKSKMDSESVKVNEQANSNNAAVAWHYAFPLSPEDEAKQAASMIHKNKHTTPLIIVPDSNYGKRVATAFKEQWAALTPESEIQVEAHYFTSKAKLATFIDDVLHTGKSKRRINQMKAITRVSLKTEVRSRRDVDAIYIVSKRDELILLKPFIDVSVSPFAQKMPLYASSRSHSYDRHKMQNKELSHLVFSDNPFLLEQDSDFNKEIQRAWKRQPFSTLRLFALGYDSYQIIEQLMHLQDNSEAVYKGLIGDLRIDNSNTIQATLSWAKYQDGALFEVTPTTAAE